MNESAGGTNLEFPINQKLLEEATQTKEEWRVVKDRLAKIEDHKNEVTQAVYERVRSDYRGRLKGVTEAVLAKKEEVDRELAVLREAENRIVSELERHRQNLEEIKFRNTLGEYSDESYQTAAHAEQERISKFEAVLAAVDGNIHRYASLYENEPDLFPQKEPAAPREEFADVSNVGSLSTTAPDAEPITDAAGYVLEEEGGYFSAAEGAKATFDESKTEISNTGEGAEAEGEPARARIIVINGEEAGTAYPIRGVISFGRAETSTIPIRDAKASRQHAQIQQHGSEFVLVDLNSSNGTFVNGGRIEEHVLSNGDEIRIGDAILQFQA